MAERRAPTAGPGGAGPPRIAAGPAALAGQMAAASADSLLPGQAFAAEHAMAWLAGQMAASQDEGYRPCRGRYRNGRHGWGDLEISFPEEHGHGLWMVRQLAGQFHACANPAGTIAAVTFALPASGPWSRLTQHT